jgi:hypothetical protein
MATPIRFTPARVQSAIRQARTLGRRQPYPLPKIQAQPSYVRPAITGQSVGSDEIPSQRPSFFHGEGELGGALGHPATGYNPTPPAPGQVPLPPPSGPGQPGPIGAPGRGSGPLSWNPQLIFPDTALAKAGALDSTYTNAKNAALTDFYSKYHKTLQDLGYMDPKGQYMEGNINLLDTSKRWLHNQELGEEARVNTENARDAGILFSGLRASNLERAQRQTVQDLADLDINTAQGLSQGYTDAETYRTDLNNALIAAYNEAMYRKFGTYDYSYQAPSG